MPGSLADDEFAYAHIKHKWRDDELALFELEWFDYRFMHPTQATYAYADAYEKAWRQAAKTNFDREKARKARIANANNLRDQKPAIVLLSGAAG